MTITAEQADQVKDIILNTLDTFHQGKLPLPGCVDPSRQRRLRGHGFR